MVRNLNGEAGLGTESDDGANGDSGREKSGRFAPGNKIGRGNPAALEGSSAGSSADLPAGTDERYE